MYDHLSDKDAQFVDIIHTDAGLYGQPISTGTVDFWPNSGKTLQRGCPKRSYVPLSDNGNLVYVYNDQFIFINTNFKI